MSDPISTLGLSCPSGGQFYICQGNTTQFLGCCNSDPCVGGKGECPQADLRYSSFNASGYGEIRSQTCSNTTGKWYTCASGLKNPFLGCCSTNACGSASGCPTTNLLAARLSDDKSSAAAFVTTAANPSSMASTASKTATSSSISSTGTAVASGTTSSSTTATGTGVPQDSSSSGLSTAAKAGIGVSCAVAIVALVGVLLFFARRMLRDRKGVVVRGSEPPTPRSMMRDNPATSPCHYDPNQILWSQPSLCGSSHDATTSVFVAKSPAESYVRSFSASSSPPTDFVSRQTSVRSGSSNGLGMVAPSPLSENSQPFVGVQQYASTGQYTATTPYMSHLQSLETVAELDGTDMYGTRPTSEMSRASPTPAQSKSLSSSTYQPYRQGMEQE